jgi:hypothetical protein
MALVAVAWWLGPCRDFVPAADSLSCARKKVSKESTPAKPPGVAGFPAMLEAQGRAELTSLRSVQTGGAKSVLDARFARALGFCASRRFRRGDPEQPTAQQPNAKPDSRLAPAVLHSPLEPAEERRGLRACAQRTSSTDSAQLSDRSVAEGVLRGASRSEHRRAARCEAKGRADRGRLFAFFLVAQKEGRPPGRRPGMGLPNKQVRPST